MQTQVSRWVDLPEPYRPGGIVHASAMDFQSKLTILWLKRRMFVTTNGRVGFASEDVRQGDLVCMLYSGYCIYLLRKRPERGTYTFVYDGYTHGLMQGESFDLMDRGQATEQLFDIE